MRVVIGTPRRRAMRARSYAAPHMATVRSRPMMDRTVRRSLTLRLVVVPFLVELPYVVLCPLGYLKLFEVERTDRAKVIASIAVLTALKAAFMALFLVRFVRPIRAG